MSMIDVLREDNQPPMLVVGIGHATEHELEREGLEMHSPDLHVLETAATAGIIAVAATRSE